MSFEEPSDGKIIALFVLGAVGFIAFTIFGAASCEQYSCKKIGIETGLETKWDVWSTCYVKVNGKWVPKDAWREVER